MDFRQKQRGSESNARANALNHEIGDRFFLHGCGSERHRNSERTGLSKWIHGLGCLIPNRIANSESTAGYRLIEPAITRDSRAATSCRTLAASGVVLLVGANVRVWGYTGGTVQKHPLND